MNIRTRISLLVLACMIYCSSASGQYFRFFSDRDPGESHRVTASCVKADTVYAVAQGRTLERGFRTYLQKINTRNGQVMMQQELNGYRFFLKPDQMLIHEDVIYIGAMAVDTIALQVDKHRLSDLSLISRTYYNANPAISGYPLNQIVLFGDHLIYGGSQNELLNEDGDIGFTLWIDHQTMELDTLIIYDEPDKFYNGVFSLGVHEDELLVRHASGDFNDFLLTTYQNDRQVVSRVIMEGKLRNSNLSSLDIGDNGFFISEGQFVGLVPGGFRIFHKNGTVKDEYAYFEERDLGIDIYLRRGRTASNVLETSTGDLLLYGEGQVDLDQQEPFVPGPFTEANVREAAFITKYIHNEEELSRLWDYSYIDFDVHSNNKFFSYDHIHELENGDLFAFGTGNESLDSFVHQAFITGHALLTCRMDQNGCFELDSCGANDVFYFLPGESTSTTDIDNHRNDLYLYPQPAQNVLYLEGLSATTVNYKIYDLSGVLLFVGTRKDNEPIDIETLEPGLYLLQVYDAATDDFSVAKFVKN